MKKTLLSICAVSVCAALVMPKIIAGNVKSNIDTIVEQINNQPGYVASISELHSGWFDSNAKITISFDDIFGNDLSAEVSEQLEAFAIELVVDVNHGPVLTTGEHALGLAHYSVKVANEQIKEYLEWDTTSPIYEVSSHVNLFGNISYTDKIQPFTITEKEENIEFNFTGYQGSGVLVNDEWQYVGQSNQMLIKTENGDVVIDTMDVDMTVSASIVEMLSSGFYDSDTTFNIRSISFEDKDKTEDSRVVANNLYIKANSKINTEKNTGNIGITYGLDTFTMADFKAENLALAIEINNLSKRFIDAYQENINELSQGSPSETEAKLLQFIETHLLSLVKAEPEVNITSLRGTFEQGSFDSEINTSLVGVNAMPDVLADVDFWLSHLLADGQLTGDKAVIEYIAAKIMESQLKKNPQTAEMTSEEIEQIAVQQVPQLLQNFIQQGLLIAKDEQYSTSFVLKNKAFSINDKPIPLPF